MHLDKINNKIRKQMSFIKKKIISNKFIVFELEADSTISSEYVLLMHFLGDIDTNLEKKISEYLVNRQNKDGGWPLFYGGESNLSASVKSYFALKLSGYDENTRLMLSAKKKNP